MIELGDKLLALAGVPPEKIAECLEWAFGEISESETLTELAKRWNHKHGDIFTVNLKKDKVKPFIWSVGKAYVLYILPDHKIIVPDQNQNGSGRFN